MMGAIGVLLTCLILGGIFIFLLCMEIKKEREKNASLSQDVSNLNQTIEVLNQKFIQDTKQLRDSLEAVLMENVEIRNGIPKLIEQARADAVKTSQAVLKGRISEELSPFSADFPYQGSDLRHLGTPIDFVCFDGMSKGEVKQIILLDIKTGQATLSKKQKRIKKCVENHQIKFEVFKLK